MVRSILVALLIAVSAFATYLAITVRRLKRLNAIRNGPHGALPSTTALATTEPEISLGMAMIDHAGTVVLRTEEFSSIPSSVQKIHQSDVQVNRLGQMASDLLSSTARLPGKTIRLAFKPEIARGLQDGTYTLMTTKGGETLADAVKVSANGAQKIAGKGRIVQGGQATQIASGAFMLLSIAVSQAHLANIERSLGTLKKSLDGLRNHIENQDQAKILGALDYLQDMVPYLQDLSEPHLISSEKSHAIENLIRDSFDWLRLVQKDLDSLIADINAIESKDTLGTYYTYKEIMRHVDRLSPLAARYEMYLQLATAAATITSYLDPMHLKFSRPRARSADWLSSIDNYKEPL